MRDDPGTMPETDSERRRDQERTSEVFHGIFIVGPTASGKTRLALELAERLAASDTTRRPVIVNADAMQVYAHARILTARPGPQETARIQHRLYGTVGGEAPYSVGSWRLEALKTIREAEKQPGMITPIFVGGGGLYYHALCRGLAPIPAVPDSVRQAVRDAWLEHGLEALYKRLQSVDPRWAAGVCSSDAQRVLRGLEVYAATQRPLSSFFEEQTDTTARRPGWVLALYPDKAENHARAAQRFEAMLRAGGLEEARSLLSLPDSHPLARAVGVRDLCAHVRGLCSYDQAVERAQQKTRHLIKRQRSWMRHHLSPDVVLHDPEASARSYVLDRLAALLASGRHSGHGRGQGASEAAFSDFELEKKRNIP